MELPESQAVWLISGDVLLVHFRIMEDSWRDFTVRLLEVTTPGLEGEWRGARTAAMRSRCDTSPSSCPNTKEARTKSPRGDGYGKMARERPPGHRVENADQVFAQDLDLGGRTS